MKLIHMRQVDVDELWSVDAIVAAYNLLVPRADVPRAPAPMCLRVHCHFFVTPTLVTVTRNGYGHSDSYEWTRVWRFHRFDRFVSHAPPILAHLDLDRRGHPNVRTRAAGVVTWQLLGQAETEGSSSQSSDQPCMMPEDAAAAGVAFTHYAYVLPNQVSLTQKTPKQMELQNPRTYTAEDMNHHASGGLIRLLLKKVFTGIRGQEQHGGISRHSLGQSFLAIIYPGSLPSTASRAL